MSPYDPVLRADHGSVTVLNDWGVRKPDRLKPGD